MPIELRNQSKRKSTSKVKPQLKKAKKAEMTDEKLEVLEQKEKLLKDDDEKSNKGDNDSDDELDDVRYLIYYKPLVIINLNPLRRKRVKMLSWMMRPTT